jgi:hypothetical protein
MFFVPDEDDANYSAILRRHIAPSPCQDCGCAWMNYPYPSQYGEHLNANGPLYAKKIKKALKNFFRNKLN